MTLENEEGSLARPRRVGPSEVKPVEVGGVQLKAVHWGRERGFAQNGGYVSAHNPASGEELWILKVYDVQYDSALEEDVQDIFIESMEVAPSGKDLEVVDEKGRRYLVDPIARSVTAI